MRLIRTPFARVDAMRGVVTPILDPFAPEVRFTFAESDTRHAILVHREGEAFREMPDPGPFVASPEIRRVDRRPYASQAIGWRGCVYVAEGDEARLLAAAAEAIMAILVVAWLAGKAHVEPEDDYPEGAIGASMRFADRRRPRRRGGS